MLLFNLMEDSLNKRMFCKVLIKKYGFNFNEIDDLKDESFFKVLSEESFKDFIYKYDLIVIENGYRKCQRKYTDIIKKLNKKTLFTEIGHLPQNGTIHIDYKGMYHDSSICENLDWVSEEDILSAQLHFKQSIYSQFMKNQKMNYILCVLQMDWDASLFKTGLKNIDLINYCLEKYENEKIIFKFHPRHTDQEKQKIKLHFLSKNLSFDETTPLLFLAKNAKKIVGMSSTSLVEGLAINKEVEAIAECPIYYHQKNNTFDRDKILTAYFLHQYDHSNYKAAEKCLDFVLNRANYSI